MALQDAIAAVQVLVKTISGIREAPAYPPEQLELFPYAVAYSGGGVWEFGPAGDKKGLHNIVVELHIQRKALARDVSAAMAYSDSIPNILMKNPTLSGTVNTFQSISYTFGPLGYGGIETIGFKFTISNVKMQTAIT